MLHITDSISIKANDTLVLEINHQLISGMVINSGTGVFESDASEYLLGALYFLGSEKLKTEQSFNTGFALVETEVFDLEVIRTLPKVVSIKKQGSDTSASLQLISILSGKYSYLLFLVLA